MSTLESQRKQDQEGKCVPRSAQKENGEIKEILVDTLKDIGKILKVDLYDVNI